jgi:hypothetical protein
VTAKSIILAIIAQNGVGGGTGYVFSIPVRQSARSVWKSA